MPLNQSIIEKRNKIIKRNNFKLLKVFDTNEHEDYKDVVLVLDPKDNKKKVLRVGEHRTKNFFYRGYHGKSLIIPKIYKINTEKNNPYEIEEFIPGKLIHQKFKVTLADSLIPDKYIDLMIKSFWEFQKVAQKQRIPRHKVWNEKIKKHYNYATVLIDNPDRVTELLNKPKIKKFFQNNKYLCKWKFSIDNLIVTDDNKLGFIDLARVSKSFWGYDLGWIFWPSWFHLTINEYKKANKHFKYLEKLFKKINKLSPKSNRVDIIYSGYLLILERIIGTFFDLSAQISHAQKINSQNKKRKAYIKFLNELLILTIDKIEKYK